MTQQEFLKAHPFWGVLLENWGIDLKAGLQDGCYEEFLAELDALLEIEQWRWIEIGQQGG